MRRIALAVLVLALASQIAVPLPFSPVPLTLQSLAVVLIGAVLGPSLGAAAVALWLILAASGLPLLSNFNSGFGGPTSGYLIAMPAAAAIAGLRPTLTRMLAAHALILICGTAWLTVSLGASKALGVGLWPFLPGAILKSLAAALIISRLRRSKTSAKP